jgi:hypothetical protein
VDPVPDPLLLRKSGSAGNRTRTLDLKAGTLTTRPQKRSIIIAIIIIIIIITYKFEVHVQNVN